MLAVHISTLYNVFNHALHIWTNRKEEKFQTLLIIEVEVVQVRYSKINLIVFDRLTLTFNYLKTVDLIQNVNSFSYLSITFLIKLCELSVIICENFLQNELTMQATYPRAHIQQGTESGPEHKFESKATFLFSSLLTNCETLQR